MCTECGSSAGVHFESCSQHVEPYRVEDEQQLRGAEALYDMVRDRMEISLHSLAKDQFKSSLFKAFLSESAIEQMAKNTVWQITSDPNFDVVRTMASMHMLGILMENDIVNTDKFDELLTVLGWSAPDAIG